MMTAHTYSPDLDPDWPRDADVPAADEEMETCIVCDHDLPEEYIIHTEDGGTCVFCRQEKEIEP